MEIRELTSEEKKQCITVMKDVLRSRMEEFLCHGFSFFIKHKTEIFKNTYFNLNYVIIERHMHILFPELYNELKDLTNDAPGYERYNLDGSRVRFSHAFLFNEWHKCPIWDADYYEERLHFLNDLLIKYEAQWK